MGRGISDAKQTSLSLRGRGTPQLSGESSKLSAERFSYALKRNLATLESIRQRIKASDVRSFPEEALLLEPVVAQLRDRLNKSFPSGVILPSPESDEYKTAENSFAKSEKIFVSFEEILRYQNIPWRTEDFVKLLEDTVRFLPTPTRDTRPRLLGAHALSDYIVEEASYLIQAIKQNEQQFNEASQASMQQAEQLSESKPPVQSSPKQVMHSIKTYLDGLEK